MATYKLSPAERRARAQAIMERRENRYTVANYVNEQKKAAAAQADMIRQKEIEWENERNSQGFLVRGISTIGDLAANVLTGAIKGLEGIYDLGASIVGGVGGLFSKDFQNSVKEHVAYDWTGETIGNPLQELTKYSYTDNGGLIENVASGVGQILPAVAVTVLTAGAGAPAAVSNIASLGTLGASAAGNSTEAAFNDGAGYWQGLGYGIASGAVEVATEKLTGGLTKGVFGRGLLDDVGKSVANTGVRRVVRGAIEEGAEEIIAEVANPTLKAIYKGKSAFEEYKDPEYWKGVAEAGVVGGLTSLAYGGTVGKIINTAKGVNEDISDSLTQIETLEKKRNNLFSSDKLTEKNESKIADNIVANYRNVETALQKASEKNRAKYIKNYNLSEAFEADGTMKSDFAAKLAYTAQVGQTNAAEGEATQKPLASLDKRYYHPSLRGREQQISEQLAKQGTQVYSGELTETEQANYSRLKKAFNALSQKGLIQPDFVLAESSDNFYSYLDGKTVVFGKDTLESDLWQQKIIHEVEHFTEGTKEWADFASFVLNETDTTEAVQSVLRKDYGITQADVETLQSALAEGKLTDNHRLLLSEVMATQSEALFGNEQMIERLTTTKRGLAHKLLDRIKNFVKVLKAKTPEEKAVIKKLKKAQQLFEKALGKAGTKYAASQVDSDSETQYNRKRKKRTPYSQYRTLAMQWAYASDRTNGDRKALYNASDNTWNLIVADDSDEGFSVLQSVKDTAQNVEAIQNIFGEVYNEDNRGEQRTSELVRSDIEGYESAARDGNVHNESAQRRESNGRTRGVHQEESQRNRGGDSRQGGGNNKVKFSLKDSIEKDVVAHYGKTYSWAETGYILKDGTRLDLSGRRDGASGGYRAVDHRDIFDIYEDVDGSDALVEFMSRGNIRVSPENPGINLQVEPTDEQYRLIQDMVERLGWKDEYFSVDFDNAKGDTIDSLTYNGKVSARKVVADIKYYFKEGKIPYQSNLSQFRYSLKPVKPVKPNSNKWERTIDTDEAIKRFPNLWNVKAEESEERNPTQIKGTVSTYRKIYEALKSEDFRGKILDASSGLGYGTRAGIDEYGFNVDDIEPYPDKKYKPKFTDYSLLDEKYDVIISNAVLNVLPQDQRDALVVKMGELLKENGRIFVNVRGDDVNNLSSNHNNVKIGEMEWYVSPTGSYQKGFTKAELVAYLQDALGEGYEVKPSAFFGKSAAVVTKIARDTAKYSLKDSEGKALTEQQAEYFRDSKVRDSEGNLLVVYHGTMSGEFTVFDASRANVESDMGAGFYFFSDYADVGSNYENGGQDLTAKIERRAEQIEAEEEIDYDEAKKKATEELAKGSKLFEVYLDIKNPAYVGGNFDEATILKVDLDDGGIKIEDFDNEDDYYEAQWEAIEVALQEFYDRVEGILLEEGISGYEDWTGILSPIDFFDGGATITELKEGLNNTLYDVYDENGNYASNEVLRAIVEALGYDGIIDNSVVDKWGYNSGRTSYMEGIDEETRHYIVFSPNQIKLTTNETPTLNEDIRFSLKDKYFYQFTDGQIKRLIANNTKFKVYSKADAESIVNNILDSYMSFGDKYGDLRGKSKNEVIEILWRGLNAADPGKQAGVALDVAEYIIQHSAMENLWDDMDNQSYIDTIAALKPYLHSLNLTGIRGEIKHRYDTDNSPYLIWGKRKGEKGQGVDVVAQELAEQGFYIEAINEADIFFEIDSAYRNALQAMKKQARQMLNDSLSKEEKAKLKQKIAREVLRGFDYTGKKSTLSKIVDKYADRAKVWKEKYLEEKNRNKAINRLLYKAQKMRDLKLGTFLNASQFKSDIFKSSIEKLANIKYRGDLNQGGTRKTIAGLAEWYSKDNPILEGLFDEEVSLMLESVSQGEGKLSVDEIKMLDNIVSYFTHFVETYNKVYRNGKYEDALPIAKNYVETMRRNKPVKVGVLRNFFEKYTQTFADPMTVARYMDRYDDGFYSDILATLREGAVNASVMEMEMREPLEEFYKKRKAYLKGLKKRTIEYQGQKIPVQQALLLYMTLNREQALAGLAKSGFVYEDGKETVRLKGFNPADGLTVEELKVLAKEQQKVLEGQFTEADKEYIAIAEKLFNETCKEAKRKTDILRKGYSNALEDYYVPIRRAYISHSVDTSTFADEMDRVSNASFNRDTVIGAKNELFIESLEAVLDRHIRAVSQYANLSMAIDEYDKLFNLDVADNPNKPTSVRTESAGVWKKGDEYFKKLISDMQGIPVVKGEGTKAMGFIRSGYAKYQLGANPKVWVTQLSSFAAAGSILDVSSITKGLNVKSADVDEYCPLAKVRNNDNTVALAQGVIENVGKVGDVLMKPIGKVDRFVIKKLFGACQVQVQKDSGLKIGTEENKKKAGELLTKVILETQQNALSTERSAAMRSGNELVKTLTMFSSDAMKVVGRVIDSVGELSVLKHKRKTAIDAEAIERLDKQIKSANKKVRKSVAALATSAVFMALMAQLFRWLYNKDDEEETGKMIAVDALGNLLGGLPIFKDIYARFAEGYDIDNYAYSTINNLFDSAQNLFDIASGFINGDTENVAKNVRNLFYAVGQLFGIPVRNIYNVGYGLINRFSPSTAYKIDDMFYNKNYRSDLKKAIEAEDEDMIATIVGIMLDENIGEVTNSFVRNEIDRLVKAGYDVIPKSVGSSITYEGDTTELTAAQVAEFKTVYATAHEAVASLVSMSQYGAAEAEVQAKAIDFIYDTYYNLAVENLLGVDIESKNTLFAEAIDIEKLAIIVATARQIAADTDKNGKAVSGTRKAKIQAYINSLRLTAAQKYMIMGYLGYSNTKGEPQVKSYINTLPMSKTEKAQLLEWSGYAA